MRQAARPFAPRPGARGEDTPRGFGEVFVVRGIRCQLEDASTITEPERRFAVHAGEYPLGVASGPLGDLTPRRAIAAEQADFDGNAPVTFGGEHSPRKGVHLGKALNLEILGN